MKKIIILLTLVLSFTVLANEEESKCGINEGSHNYSFNRINKVGFHSAELEAKYRIKAGALETCIETIGRFKYLVSSWETFHSDLPERVKTIEIFLNNESL